MNWNLWNKKRMDGAVQVNASLAIQAFHDCILSWKGEAVSFWWRGVVGIGFEMAIRAILTLIGLVHKASDHVVHLDLAWFVIISSSQFLLICFIWQIDLLKPSSGISEEGIRCHIVSSCRIANILVSSYLLCFAFYNLQMATSSTSRWPLH